jgi:arylsulfatase A-like enzyme
MTGKYAHATGLVANHYPIPLDQDFLAEIFRDAGYRTGYFGKWHLNGGPKHSFVRPEERLGFEHFIGFSRGHAYEHSIYYKGDSDQPCTSKRYEPDYQTDHLIGFMEKCATEDGDSPFLAMICYGMPHPPLVAPAHFLNLYSPEEIPISDAVPVESQDRAREFLAKYYGLVAHLDNCVGRVLAWLDKSGLADNTIVVLVSDHGDMAGDHGRFGKKVYYDGSMRVPMLVRYPRRFPAGHVVESLVDPSVNTMPTLLELCGLPVPESVQGCSYVSLLEGGSEPIRNEIYYEICKEEEGPEAFPVPERGVRTPEWLYVRTEKGPTVFFDLKNDPLESTNLVNSDGHREVVERLDKLLADHMERTLDDWRIEAVFPPENFQTHAEGHEYAQELLKKAVVEP